MKRKFCIYLYFFGSILSLNLLALEKTITVHALTVDGSTQGIGKQLGTIHFQDSPQGLLIKPDLHGLQPGKHGFHIHEKPACDRGFKDGKWQAGLAAGSHFDPLHTKHHMGPEGQGHLGDLPVLEVNQNGYANQLILAPRLQIKSIQQRSVIIHEGGDNYTDNPPLGGGGLRVACGLLE